jgi:type IV pilus assembly protein PilM
VFNRFTAKKRSILGIDITSSAIKIIQLCSFNNGFHVEAYGCESLSPDAIEGNIIKDVDAVTLGIKKVLAKTKFTVKQVALAVPDSLVISKIVQINEGLTDQEMEELVVIEADKYIPYPIDEISLDFEVQGASAKNPTLLDVLIVASRAKNVQGRVEAITKAGLEPTIVDMDSYAIERVAPLLAENLPSKGHGKIVPIIDIGANNTNLYVLNNMKIIYSREERFGGMQLIESIAEHYKMTIEEAKSAQRDHRLPKQFSLEVLEPFKDRVLMQIKRTLQFFYSTSHHSGVDHILLAGGLEQIEEIASLIENQLNVTTTVANPFINMSHSKNVNFSSLTHDAPALLVACGLALRDGRKYGRN